MSRSEKRLKSYIKTKRGSFSAIYDRYKLIDINDISKLKDFLAKMESFFHGSSSGLMSVMVLNPVKGRTAFWLK